MTTTTLETRSPEWTTQLRCLRKFLKRKPVYVVPVVASKNGMNRGAVFQAQQGELRRSEIIEYLMRVERATSTQMSRYLGTSDTCVRAHMKVLADKGIARMVENFNWELV